jgi:hypothetical protein
MTYKIYLISRDTDGVATKTDITSNVLIGFSEHSKLDESLDIGSLTVQGVTKDTPYTMFDSIQIKIDNVEVLNQRISGDTVELMSKKPLKYRHKISLVEHTKILELFTISGKTFRNGINNDDNFLGDYSTNSTLVEFNPTVLGSDFINEDLLALNKSAVDGDYYYVYSTTQGQYGIYELSTIVATAIQEDKTYIITTVGTTDFTLIGATSNTIGEIFKATTSGTGTGTCSTWDLTTTPDYVYPSSYSLFDLVDIINDTTPFEMSDILDDYRLFVYDSGSTLYPTFIQTESPEFTFKDQTVRECLNKIGGVIDAIPRLVMVETDTPSYDYSMELTWDLVNDLKELIASEDDFINKNKEQDIDFYSTQFESDGLNVVNDNYVEESVETYPLDGSWVSPRTDQYYFDYTKSFIPTPKNIYRPIDVKYLMYGYIATTTTGGAYGNIASPVFIEISLKNWIVEWNIYKTLSEDERQENLTYRYKNKNIQLGDTFGLFDTVISFQRVLEQGIIDKMIEEGYMETRGEALTWADENQLDWTDGYMLFQVDYIPIPDSIRVNIDRQDLSDINKNSQLIANQQNRIVNLENFTNNIQGKINRLGNSELSLENRVFDYDDLNDIGDYTSDLYIVTERELIFHKDYIYAIYQLSKNYNMISKFISVNSENRQYEITEQNTLKRKLIYKEYVEIDILESSDTYTPTNTTKLLTDDGKKCIMDTFNISSSYNPVNGSIVDSSETTEDLICSFSSNGGGNSLIFDFQFPSNNYVGQFIEGVGSPVQYANNFASYVDSFGKMETTNFYLFDKLDLSPTTYADYLSYARNYPKTDKDDININYIVNDSPFVVYKDSAEELGGTLQLQFVSKDLNKVGIGRFLLRRNRLITFNPPKGLKFYYSNTNQFGRLDTFKVDTSKFTKSSNTTIISYSYASQKLQVINTDLTSTRSAWAITDEADNVLVWCNQDGDKLDTITFDFNNKRSGINYKY